MTATGVSQIDIPPVSHDPIETEPALIQELHLLEPIFQMDHHPDPLLQLLA